MGKYEKYLEELTKLRRKYIDESARLKSSSNYEDASRLDEKIKEINEVIDKINKSNHKLDGSTVIGGIMDGVYEEQQEIEYEKFIYDTLSKVVDELMHIPSYNGSNADEVKARIQLKFIPNDMNIHFYGNIDSLLGKETNLDLMKKDCIQLIINDKKFTIPSDINLYNHILEVFQENGIQKKDSLSLGKSRACVFNGTLSQFNDVFVSEKNRIEYDHYMDRLSVSNKNKSLDYSNFSFEEISEFDNNQPVSDDVFREMLSDVLKAVQFSCVGKYYSSDSLNNLPIKLTIGYNNESGAYLCVNSNEINETYDISDKIDSVYDYLTFMIYMRRLPNVAERQINNCIYVFDTKFSDLKSSVVKTEDEDNKKTL